MCVGLSLRLTISHGHQLLTRGPVQGRLRACTWPCQGRLRACTWPCHLAMHPRWTCLPVCQGIHTSPGPERAGSTGSTLQCTYECTSPAGVPAHTGTLRAPHLMPRCSPCPTRACSPRPLAWPSLSHPWSGSCAAAAPRQERAKANSSQQPCAEGHVAAMQRRIAGHSGQDQGRLAKKR
jgi:hypothetical protein